MDDLLSALRALQARVDALERHVALAGLSVEAALRRRGWRTKSHSSLDHVLLPRPADAARLDRYYQDLHRYHFRRLLQEAAEAGVLTPGTVRKLEARWGPRAVARTFNRLVDYGLLDAPQDTYTLTVPAVRSFGGTLEWFVAQVLMREFLAPAAWDVRVQEIRQGGDFDVLAVLDGRLGYFECKASPPYNISADALAQVVERTRHLRPDFAVLVLDTTLRIDRNIIANMNPLVRSSLDASADFTRVTEGIYEANAAVPVYIVISRRSLVANLGRCLRRIHAGPRR